MPKFKEWAENVIGIDMTKTIEKQKDIPIDPPIENIEFIKEITGKVEEISDEKNNRIMHSHGHTL
jgi:hypothetical protein